MDQEILNQERDYLASIQAKIAKTKTKLETALEVLDKDTVTRLKELRDDAVADPHDLFVFMEGLSERYTSFNVKDKLERLREYTYLLKEAFFARIDLGSKQTNQVENFYIGKFGYAEEKPLVLDWRTKVASVYYRYRYPQKNVEYTTLEGKEVRDLVLKRTYELDNGVLVKYYNNDIQFDESHVIADKISERSGGVLEDIIETIQESQLNIIESDPRKITVVQGCVGSGKSTVAIHKLSHIFFNYPDVVKPELALLVTKNRILLTYLATLFPKLGIFDVTYKTLRDLVFNLFFREKFTAKFNFDKNTDLSGFTLTKAKLVLKHVEEVHAECQKLISQLQQLPENESFSSFVYDRNLPVAQNIDEYIADLTDELNFQKEYLKENPNDLKLWIYTQNIATLKKLIADLRKIKRSVSEKKLMELLTLWGVSLDEELDYFQALLFIFFYSEVYGLGDKFYKYQYCVVDEGQDFNVLEYMVLSKFVQRGRFCILGDLNQSYLAEGLTTWDYLSEVILEAKDSQVFTLETNYRSTKQIITFANKILAPHTTDFLPKSIERLGPEPTVVRAKSQSSALDLFYKALLPTFNPLTTSVGIICMTVEVFDQANAFLTQSVKQGLLSEDKLVRLDPAKRINYIPKGIYLMNFSECKGLEFSKVFILGEQFNTVPTFIAAKKEFVAVTRAMSELYIYTW